MVLLPIYQSIVASGLHKLVVHVSSLGVPAVNISKLRAESVLPRYVNVTDVTLTENRNKYYFLKVHNCQCITSGKCVALIPQGDRCHFN